MKFNEGVDENILKSHFELVQAYFEECYIAKGKIIKNLTFVEERQLLSSTYINLFQTLNTSTS